MYQDCAKSKQIGRKQVDSDNAHHKFSSQAVNTAIPHSLFWSHSEIILHEISEIALENREQNRIQRI